MGTTPMVVGEAERHQGEMTERACMNHTRPAANTARVCIPRRASRDDLLPGGISVLQGLAVAGSITPGVSNNRSPTADQQGQGRLGEYAGEIPFRKSRP